MRKSTVLVATLLLPGLLRAAPPASTSVAPAPATPPCRMGMGHPPCGMDAGRGGMHAMGPGGGQKRGGVKPPADAGNPPVYGWQLMTPDERAAYRAQLRAAKTVQERSKIRAEHHKEMQERARQQGVTLPETPPR